MRIGRWLADFGIPQWIIKRPKPHPALPPKNAPLPWFTVKCACGATCQTRFEWAAKQGKCRSCVWEEHGRTIIPTAAEIARLEAAGVRYSGPR